MSESVKIGGFGKNPAIDKINRLNTIDVKNHTVEKMEKLLLVTEPEEEKYIREVPIDFSEVDWEGKTYGRK